MKDSTANNIGLVIGLLPGAMVILCVIYVLCGGR